MNDGHLVRRRLAFLLVAWCAAGALRADDWPQWRGPQRDGVWREDGIVESLPAGGLPIRWRARIDRGYSGPVVAEGRAYVTDHVLQPKEVERVLCFDAATGAEQWSAQYPVSYAEMEYGNGPRAAPTVHDGRVYTLGTQAHLHCLDAITGDILWRKDLAQEYQARVPRYGVSAAPLVEGDLLIVCVGGLPAATVVAFDRATGEERWRALDDRPAYSAPLVITAAGRRQAIVWTADNVNSLDPQTGEILWQVPYVTTFDEAQVVASPVWRDDRLLCLTAWNRGSFLLQLDAAAPAASVVWKTRAQPTTTISTPLFADDGCGYLVDGGGNLCCIDGETGEELWHAPEAVGGRGGSAHLTPHGERTFLFDDQGHLILARLSRDGYHELGRTLLVEPTAGYRAQPPVTWAHPAYANRCVYARNDRELVCVSLAAAEIAAASPQPSERESQRLEALGGQDVAAALAVAPDGSTLALATDYGAVTLLDLAAGKTLPGPSPHRDWICALAFSPDGKYLASAGGSEFRPARNHNATSGEVKLWDVAAQTEHALAGHTNKVFAASFSPDGSTLATGGADQSVRLWDVATRKPRAVLTGHADAVRAVAFSPDGATLASADSQGAVQVWDMATLDLRGSFAASSEEVNALAYSPDGRTLATGGADWNVQLWNAATWERQGVLQGHRGSVYCLAFDPSGQCLASGSADENVILWNVAAAEQTTVLSGHASGVVALAYSPAGQELYSAGRTDSVRLWQLAPAP